ncbi:LuxR C-terminal-related transcriptional regulator [Streptomyces sp. NBC_01288]|uniref:ATP-binding protein n=1 Tax=Streptomyces sp. NBC_01288 TaxID=2903814 RepID=UPI002E13C17F|nr:LuxR C-terminal-related transcriptional regulator [Streptomyces sp. NBC_01288]
MGQPRPGRAVATAGPLQRRTDAFVGRRRELSEIDELFARAKVVTLTGQAGIGKTRLALEYVKGAGARFTEVHSLDVETAGDEDLAPGSAFLSALHAAFAPGRSGRVRAVGDGTPPEPRRRVLAHLDGCDHRIDVCSRLIEKLLPEFPGLSFLVTSRESLSVPEESVLRVDALPLPEDGAPHIASVLLRSDAVLLFVERARAVDRHFRLGQDNLAGVVDVCRSLEGIPLGLEMAARWVRLLCIEDIRVALADPLTFLLGEAGLADGRTFSSVIGGSHSLLGDRDRRFSRRLAVFPGEFGIEAATAVCADEGEGPAAVLETLLRLESRCLLRGVDQGPGQGRRFRQAAPLRKYELQRLMRAGEFDRTHDRLVEWLTEITEPFHGPSVPPAAEVAPVCREVEALHRALEWTSERGDSRGHALAPALARSLLEQGDPVGARRVLCRALAVPGPENGHRASLEWFAAWHAFGEGDYRTALERSSEAARMERPLHRPARLILALALAAACHLELEERAPGAALCAEALRALSAVEDPAVWNQAALCLVEIHIYLGDDTEAEGLLQEYRARAGGIPFDIPAYNRERADLLTAQIAIARDDAARAERLLLDALTRNADHLRRVWLVHGLAIVSTMRGRHFRTVLLAELLKSWCATTEPRAERWWRNRFEAALAASLPECTAAQVLRARRLASELTVQGLSSWFQGDEDRLTSGPGAGASARLTERERQAVAMLADGMTNYQMARRMGVSIRTVETHLDNIRKKTGLYTRVQIGVWAQERTA